MTNSIALHESFKLSTGELRAIVGHQHLGKPMGWKDRAEVLNSVPTIWRMHRSPEGTSSPWRGQQNQHGGIPKVHGETPTDGVEQVEDYVCTSGKCHRRPSSPQSSCRCQATKHRSSQPFHSVVPRVTLMQHLHHLLLPLFRNYHPKSMEHTTILNWQLFSEFQVGCNRLVRGRTSV